MSKASKAVSFRIPLSAPDLGSAEIEAAVAAIGDSGDAASPKTTTALEVDVSRRIGAPALAVSSGTAAIHLGLRLLGVSAGDEVVVPTLTFVATCNPLLYQGAQPVFMDSDPATWNLDPDRFACFMYRRARINKLPKAVIVVHLFGLCANLKPILETASQLEVPVLEDAAAALGASYDGRSVGTLGKVGVFSLNRNKVVTGTGGGLLVCNDAEWIAKARFWSNQSHDSEREYSHSELGFNYRLSPILAGIARRQLVDLDQRVNRRRTTFFRYCERLADIPGIMPMPSDSPGFHSHWLSCFLIDEQKFGISASALIGHLASSRIEARAVWKPMHTQKLFRGCERDGGDVAEDLSARGLCLPSSNSLSMEDQEIVIETIRCAHLTTNDRRSA